VIRHFSLLRHTWPMFCFLPLQRVSTHLDRNSQCNLYFNCLFLYNPSSPISAPAYLDVSLGASKRKVIHIPQKGPELGQNNSKCRWATVEMAQSSCQLIYQRLRQCVPFPWSVQLQNSYPTVLDQDLQDRGFWNFKIHGCVYFRLLVQLLSLLSTV
jgi:hypothetical protein